MLFDIIEETLCVDEYGVLSVYSVVISGVLLKYTLTLLLLFFFKDCR